MLTRSALCLAVFKHRQVVRMRIIRGPFSAGDESRRTLRQVQGHSLVGGEGSCLPVDSVWAVWNPHRRLFLMAAGIVVIIARTSKHPVAAAVAAAAASAAEAAAETANFRWPGSRRVALGRSSFGARLRQPRRAGPADGGPPAQLTVYGPAGRRRGAEERSFSGRGVHNTRATVALPGL